MYIRNRSYWLWQIVLLIGTAIGCWVMNEQKEMIENGVDSSTGFLTKTFDVMSSPSLQKAFGLASVILIALASCIIATIIINIRNHGWKREMIAGSILNVLELIAALWFFWTPFVPIVVGVVFIVGFIFLILNES